MSTTPNDSLRDDLAARVAALKRHRPADDPELLAAVEAWQQDRWRRRLDTLLDELDGLPPLPPEDRVAIAAAVLRPVAEDGAA